MNHAITLELQFFLLSILWGGVLLLVYDIFRIIRRIISHDSFIIAVEDLLYWVAAGLSIFILMYKENNGIIRGFSIMGMLIGMVLYHNIISGFLVKLVTKFIRILLLPFSKALKQIRKLIGYLFKKQKMVINFILRRLKKWNKSVRIALDMKKQKRC